MRFLLAPVGSSFYFATRPMRTVCLTGGDRVAKKYARAMSQVPHIRWICAQSLLRSTLKPGSGMGQAHRPARAGLRKGTRTGPSAQRSGALALARARGRARTYVSRQ